MLLKRSMRVAKDFFPYGLRREKEKYAGNAKALCLSSSDSFLLSSPVPFIGSSLSSSAKYQDVTAACSRSLLLIPGTHPFSLGPIRSGVAFVASALLLPHSLHYPRLPLRRGLFLETTTARHATGRWLQNGDYVPGRGPHCYRTWIQAQ